MDFYALPILIGLRNTILRISKIGAFLHSQGQFRRSLNVRDTSAEPPKAALSRTWRHIAFGRAQDGRGSLGHAATLRFPSPLIEPDVRISRIRLSDWLHREAHETNH